MTVLRLFWLDVLKLYSVRLMIFLFMLPALLALNSWFVSVAYLVYLYLVPYGMFTHDDNTFADNLYGALPVRREQVAAARYLFALFCMALMYALMLAVNTAFCLLLDQPVLAEDFVISLTTGFVMGLVFICAAFPLVMYRGLRKANNHVLMIFVLDFIILGFYGDNLRNMRELPQVNAPSLAVFCVVALAVSYSVAVRLLNRREFLDYVPFEVAQRAKKR